MPPQNKEHEDVAGQTPVHKPPHDSGAVTTIASTVSLYEKRDVAAHTETVTNDFASFDYNSWNNRDFIYYFSSYSNASLAAVLDIAKWSVDTQTGASGPTGGYFTI